MRIIFFRSYAILIRKQPNYELISKLTFVICFFLSFSFFHSLSFSLTFWNIIIIKIQIEKIQYVYN